MKPLSYRLCLTLMSMLALWIPSGYAEDQAEEPVAEKGQGPVIRVAQGVLEIAEGANIQTRIEVAGEGRVVIGRPGAAVPGEPGVIVIQDGGGQRVVVGQGAAMIAPGPGAGLENASQTDAPERQGPAGDKDRIYFMNKDRLYGKLAGFRGEERWLMWQHPDAEMDIPFKMEHVNRIRMATRPQEASSSNFPTTVTLTNDDYLVGRLVALDADKLTLETEHCGALYLERLMIRSFSPNSKYSAMLYSGPMNLDGWELAGRNAANSWVAGNGVLVPMMQFPISRNIPDMSDLVRVRFSVEWRNFPVFNFSFGSDRPRGELAGESGYNWMVSGASIYCRRTTLGGGSGNLWNVHADDFTNASNRKIDMELFVNRKTASFALFLNRKLIKQWTDPKGYAGKGNYISFQSQVQGGIRFSGIQVLAWDGVLPSPDDDAAVPEDKDGIWFVNRDRLDGKVLSIREGKLHLKSELTDTMEVPMERVSEIHLAPEEQERARRNKGDVRITLMGGMVVTADLQAIGNGVLEARSENFDRIRIPLDRITHMDFNIYRRRLPEDREEEESDIPVWVDP